MSRTTPRPLQSSLGRYLASQRRRLSSPHREVSRYFRIATEEAWAPPEAYDFWSAERDRDPDDTAFVSLMGHT
nr:hypothetical protein GCM10017611_04060 [Rhodococcus wratislaviensis]